MKNNDNNFLVKASEIMTIMNNINYGFLDELNNDISDDKLFSIKYYLLSPEELSTKKYGVCWDQVELERKLFSDNGIPCNTYFIYIDDFKNLPSHTFLTFRANNKIYWFEHSLEAYKGIHEYADINELINDIEAKFFRSHEPLKINYKTYIYNYDLPDYHLDCDKYYEFMYSQKRVYNYKLESSTVDDIKRLKDYKQKSIIDYAPKLTEEEMYKINSYITNNIPKKINEYQNILFDNKIIGSFLVDKDENGLLLDEIFIEEEYRNKGIGSSIINHLINNASSDIYLWVYKDNKKAFQLYLNLGFNIFDETDTRYKMKKVINCDCRR